MSDWFHWGVNWVADHPWIWLAFIFHFTILGTVAYLILLERKTASWVQDRIGANRVGLDFGILPFKFLKRVNGLGQPLADGLKFIVKEDYRPKGVDRVLFTLAPVIMIVVIIISIAVLPWGGWKQSTKQVVLRSGPTPASVAMSPGAMGNEIRIESWFLPVLRLSDSPRRSPLCAA